MKIKEIKIVNQDQSTEVADIGAEAVNVDYNDTTVKAELDKLNTTDDLLRNTQTNQGNTLTNLQSQVSGLASGGPAGVYATVAALTSADPDHSKIYIVTANGHWYYYNSGWQDGGVYQSTKIEDNSIDFTQLNGKLINALNDSYKNTLSQVVTTDNLASTSYVEAQRHWGIYFKENMNIMSVLPRFSGTGTYTWKLFESTNNIAADVDLTLLDEGVCNIGSPIILNRLITTKMFLSIESATAGGFAYETNVRHRFGFLAYYNIDTNKIVAALNYRFSGIFILKNDATIWDTINFSLQKYLTTSENLLNLHDEELEENCYYAYNEKVANNEHNESGYVPCIPNKTYAYPGNSVYIECYDINRNYITTVKCTQTFRTPNDCFYFRIALNKSRADYEELMVVEGSEYPETFIPYGLEIKNSNLNKEEKHDPIYNKVCVQLGDSITWYDGHATPGGEMQKGYASYLREAGMTVNNKGVSGACIADVVSSYTDICITVDTIDFSNYDYVTIAGGINDYLHHPSPMGEISINNFNKETFIGAYQYIINKILTDNKDIKILIFTPLKSSNNNYGTNQNSEGYVLKDYINAIKEIAEYYSIPILDLYSIGGFNRLTMSSFTIDGLHPNNVGYEHVSNLLISKMNSL